MGSGNKPLVHLIQTNREEAVKSSYGLYHMAILLPSREDLADVFKHIAELDYPFDVILCDNICDKFIRGKHNKLHSSRNFITLNKTKTEWLNILYIPLLG